MQPESRADRRGLPPAPASDWRSRSFRTIWPRRARLLDWLEGDLELGDAGSRASTSATPTCVGGAPEAAEALSGHVITTHIHDNGGRPTIISCRSPAQSTGRRR